MHVRIELHVLTALNEIIRFFPLKLFKDPCRFFFKLIMFTNSLLWKAT